MFGWLPIIGPIIDGLTGVVGKFLDYKTVVYKTDGTVDIEAMKTSAQLVEATKDDIGVRLARDILIFPWALYGGLSGWDYTVAHHYPELVFNTSVVPAASGLAYLPYMVFVFLLGAVGLNIWRRK